jgi:hypothetical protein
VGAEFVAAMEDVLEVYAEPYDPRRPKVNFDETTKQLIQETRLPLPAQPGQPKRFDYEYERNGTRNLFLFVEPQAGERHVHVTEQRTKVDFAHEMQWLVDICYPEAEVIRVVLDNLNTQRIASLYEAFEPAEARRITRKLEFHLHTKTWQLVEHGRNRIERPPATMPRAPYPRRRHAQARHCGLGTPAQRGAGDHRLALFSHGCTQET